MNADFMIATTKNGDLVLVPVDTVQDFGADRTVDLTQNPIENGAEITDHLIKMPVQLSATIFATQTPIEIPADWKLNALPLNAPEPPRGGGLRGATQAIEGAIGGLLGLTPSAPQASVYKGPGDVDRIRDLEDTLIEILDNGYNVSISWKGRTVDGLTLKAVKRSDDSDGGVTFGVEFQQIQKATTQKTSLPKPKDLHAKPKKKVDAANKEDAAKQKESFLHAGKEKVTGFMGGLVQDAMVPP